MYFPRGGMRALPDALAAAAEAAGVRFRYGSPVTALERSGARITRRAHRRRERIGCDAVVLATELQTAYRLLGRAPRRPVPLRPSPSAVVLHLGDPPAAARARRTTRSRSARAWRETFRQIIDDGQPMSDPSLLITRPTASDPGLAPPGRDLLYILAPAPNLAAGPADWDATGGAYADQLISTVADRLLPGLAAEIETAQRGHPGRLGPPGPGRRHPVLLRALLLADRPVPARQPAPRRGQRRARRLRHRPRRGRAHRADLRPPGGGPGHRAAARAARPA